MTKHLCVISFDGLSTLDFDTISQLPNFRRVLDHASYSKHVYTVYPSLTYPAHATIVTGKYPKDHGVINNTLLQPERKSPDWYWERKWIKGPTLYDLAIEQGMKVAALLWPVTAKSRIQYNVPEIFANRSWQNQIIVSLLNGSPWYQIVLNHKFGHLRQGTKQPHLDNFTHQSLLYTLKEKRPDLTLVHYTDLDSMRHYHGFSSSEAQAALKRHDYRLAEIIDTLKTAGIYQDTTLVLLGDHSSLDEDKAICLNSLLNDRGYIQLDARGKITHYTAIAKTCDGSSYIYLNPHGLSQTSNAESLSDSQTAETLMPALRQLLEEFNDQYQCLESIYTREQARELGADPQCALMLEAKRGYYFIDKIGEDKVISIKPQEVGQVPHFTHSTHGYSPFKEDYTTVFIATGPGIKPGVVIDRMSLIDEGPTLARLLGLELPQSAGRVLEEILLNG